MWARLKLAGLLTLMSVSPLLAQGDGYPNKPIRWVVPYAAGGGTDVIMRPIALMLGEVLGQSILYDNRGGGGGVIAGEIVARASPDGYTMLVASPAVMTVNPSLFASMPFDPIKDLGHSPGGQRRPLINPVRVPKLAVFIVHQAASII